MQRDGVIKEELVDPYLLVERRYQGRTANREARRLIGGLANFTPMSHISCRANSTAAPTSPLPTLSPSTRVRLGFWVRSMSPVQA